MEKTMILPVLIFCALITGCKKEDPPLPLESPTRATLDIRVDQEANPNLRCEYFYLYLATTDGTLKMSLDEGLIFKKELDTALVKFIGNKKILVIPVGNYVDENDTPVPTTFTPNDTSFIISTENQIIYLRFKMIAGSLK
jgi:hypothetical protein